MKKRNLLTISFLVVGFILFLSPVTAQAVIVAYFDETTFLAQSGATAQPAIPDVGQVSSYTLGDLTFTGVGADIWIGTGGLYGSDPWTPLLPGNQIAVNGMEHLNVDVAFPIYAMGYAFAEPTGPPSHVNAPFADSVFTVSLYNGATFLDSFSYNAPNDQAYFVGVWTNQSFDQLQIREISGGIENEFYGRFYTGTTPIPEPATLFLFGTGLLGLAGFRRKRRFQL